MHTGIQVGVALLEGDRGILHVRTGPAAVVIWVKHSLVRGPLAADVHHMGLRLRVVEREEAEEEGLHGVREGLVGRHE